MERRAREHMHGVFSSIRGEQTQRKRWFQLMREILYGDAAGVPPSFDRFLQFCNDLEVSGFFGKDESKGLLAKTTRQTRDYATLPLTPDELLSGSVFRRDWR